MTEAEALSEKLLPEWEIVQGPFHATPPFRFPVYASKCRDAVAQALQSKDDRIKELGAEIERAKGLMDRAATALYGHDQDGFYLCCEFKSYGGKGRHAEFCLVPGLRAAAGGKNV